MDITFSQQQSACLKDVVNWYNFDRKNRPYYYLAGFAGTGKSTIAKYIANEIGGVTTYAAFTGKASLVMQKMGCEGASTIHSLIYIPRVNAKTGEVTFTFNDNSVLTTSSLIIIDECSMVDNKIGCDLLSYGKPILVLGDPAQLPPIEGAGFFTSNKPDFMLTEIHRQALDNPIIYLSTKVREKQKLKIGEYGDSVITNKLWRKDFFGADQILCGKNSTRQIYLKKYREYLGYDDPYPQPQEKMICLKNDYTVGLYNGEMYMVNSIVNENDFNYVSMNLSSDDREGHHVNARVLRYMYDTSFEEPDWRRKKNFQELTYGYALTTHKSQGSQWPNVFVADESNVFRDDWWRWLYTAITRASEKVTVFV